MSKLLENAANLIKVKTLVTMAVLAVYCTMALRGDIAPDSVMQITMLVVAFYFGTQYEKIAKG